jgi:cell division protein FtsQ
MPAAMMAQHHYSFPVVSGINAQDSPDHRKTRMEVYQRLLSELDANGQHLSAQISEIDLSDAVDAQVLMPEEKGDILAHFGQDHFLERYQRYKSGINEWRQQHPDLVAVDLRYEQQVVLRMATNAAQVGDGEQTAESSGEGQPPSGQVAEHGQNTSKQPEKHASGAKAPVDSAGFMPGINPRPTTRASVSATSNTAQSRPAANVKPVKAKIRLVGNGTAKVKTAATKDTSAKAGNAAMPVKAKGPVKAKATDKKRAETQRIAQKINRRKNAPATRPALSAEEGQ